MKEIVTTAALTPNDGSRFEGIGGDDEDICWAGREITSDQATFLLHQASLDPTLQPLFSKCVKRDAMAKDPANYGDLTHLEDADGICGLLNKTKPRLFQKCMEEEGPSATAPPYFRKIHLFGGIR